MLAVFILKIPELGTVTIGEALEWLFLIVLPNFCFSLALQDLSFKHQLTESCDKLFERQPDICREAETYRMTIACCPSKRYFFVTP